MTLLICLKFTSQPKNEQSIKEKLIINLSEYLIVILLKKGFTKFVGCLLYSQARPTVPIWSRRVSGKFRYYTESSIESIIVQKDRQTDRNMDTIEGEIYR